VPETGSSRAVTGDPYDSFAALAANESHGRDYRIRTFERPGSEVAIIAPHGGSIERRTSAIAAALAGEEHNLYLFEGLDASGSFEQLHITSHRFDEPRCLRLISRCNIVVAIHGCGGDTEAVYLGGLDHGLIAAIDGELAPVDVDVLRANHPYPGTHARNICNRGARRAGVQVELTDALRGGGRERHVVAAIRCAIAGLC